MKQYDIRIVGSEMRFYAEDGWNADLLSSCLDMGELRYESGYFKLAHTPCPAAFNVERLSDLCRDMLDHRGEPMKPRDRVMYLKYYSCVGVYTHGQK